MFLRALSLFLALNLAIASLGDPAAGAVVDEVPAPSSAPIPIPDVVVDSTDTPVGIEGTPPLTDGDEEEEVLEVSEVS